MIQEPPNSSSDQRAEAYQTLTQELASFKQMIEVFSCIFGLDIAEQAKNVREQLLGVSGYYSWETWGTEDGWTALDQGFSELEQNASKLMQQVDALDRSIGELDRIYTECILPQALVMLVGSLEVYLSTVFVSCLSSRSGLGDRAISETRSRYNFQNWGQTVEAYRVFLGIELGSEVVDSTKIHALLQRRHVIVHQRGTIDVRAIRSLKLLPSAVGERLRIKQSEVLESIDLVRCIARLIYDLSQPASGE